MTSVVRVCMALSFGAWMTGLLWLVLWNPWVSVFATGVMLGLALLEGAVVREKNAGLMGEVAELEKQVVSLRTALDRVLCQAEASERAKVKGGRRSVSSHSV
jgi:hypothetical protein